MVHLTTNYPNLTLEMRELEDDPWRSVCSAPCDKRLLVDGMEVRVRAPGMTESNMFRIEPGRGTARLRVSGGSETSRTIGMAGLITGIPVSFVGMGMFGYGKFKDESGLEVAGIVTLAVGGVLVLGSLPFLGAGRTSVRDGKGRVVARRSAHELPSF